MLLLPFGVSVLSFVLRVQAGPSMAREGQVTSITKNISEVLLQSHSSYSIRRYILYSIVLSSDLIADGSLSTLK